MNPARAVGRAVTEMCPAGLATELVESYCAELGQAVQSHCGCDPQRRTGFRRQFFLGNGGCWSVGFTVADSLRGKGSPMNVARHWHPHEIAGAVTTEGFAASFARLLSRDGVGHGDLIHLISGSGRSVNLVTAAKTAHASGAAVLAHCGHDGGRLRAIVPEGVQIGCFDQQVVEDALMLRLWPAWAQDDAALATITAAIERALLVEAGNLAWTVAAVVQAIEGQNPLGVVAFDVAVVSAAAEHVAHNLSWDMCWDEPALRPDVRFALSNGLLTAVANDSGWDAAPFEHMLGKARSHGVVLRLGRRDHSPRPFTSEIGIAAETFDLLRVTSRSLGLRPEDDDYLCSVFVQSWGHLLIRLGRGIVKGHRSSADAADHLQRARQPIAPRLARRE